MDNANMGDQTMNRCKKCLVAAIVLLTGVNVTRAQDSGPGQKGSAHKPNIIVILADDLGYADLGVQGCKDVPTPNIDSLARNGVRFTNGYVSCPVCSPTRAGLMTGRYQQRFGHEFNTGPPSQAGPQFGLPLTERTLPEQLAEAGYKTGMVGKWHLGLRPQFHPLRRGFEEFFGFLHARHPYLDPKGDLGDPICRDTREVDEQEYLTDAFSREAVAFIERHRQEPFFLYLAYNAVHSPMEAPPKYLDRFRSIKKPKRRTYAAMLSAMDDGIGQVLTKLRELGLESKTLIFFVSDNGGEPSDNASCNDPLRGQKAQVLEGGIRVPFLIQWLARLPAGKVYDDPVIALDVYPSAVAAASGTIPPTVKLDGADLLPYLTGENANRPHDRLFWRFGQQWAIRMGDWKLLKCTSQEPELYNLAQDIGEKNNLAANQPDKVKELQAAYDAWNAQLAEPLWVKKPIGGSQKPGK